MEKARREDILMKIPAMIHLTRLGYDYLSTEGLHRDHETNIRRTSLRAYLKRLMGEMLPPELPERIIEELREILDRRDQGEGYYRIIRNGWNGIPLVDFDHPDRNEFLVVPELTCKSDRQSFRPDLTLMVNGLPLAMIEVKTEKQENGIRAEYDRMLARLRKPEFRRFLQGTQIWAFSNNRESDENRFLPTEGACFATATELDFPLRVFSGSGKESEVPLQPMDAFTERRIFSDQGVSISENGRAYRRSLSPNTATHRMLTALFSPERFLFLLRYGIQYGLEIDGRGELKRRKNLVTAEQFFTLWQAREKIRRGFRNWQLTSRGAMGETALIVSLIRLLLEQVPGSRVYWVEANRAELMRMDRELRAWGMESTRRGKLDPAKPVLMEPGDSPRRWLQEKEERDFEGKRVFLLPSPFPGTERMNNFRKRLRTADPEAIMIRFTRGAEPEQGGNYTYLLECADGSLYCGWTNDLAQRVRTHNEGRGAKYTRGRGPVKLVYYEEFDTREEAMSREWHLKRMPRAWKEKLIRDWEAQRQERDARELPEAAVPAAEQRPRGSEKADADIGTGEGTE